MFESQGAAPAAPAAAPAAPSATPQADMAAMFQTPAPAAAAPAPAPEAPPAPPVADATPPPAESAAPTAGAPAGLAGQAAPAPVAPAPPVQQLQAVGQQLGQWHEHLSAQLTQLQADEAEAQQYATRLAQVAQHWTPEQLASLRPEVERLAAEKRDRQARIDQYQGGLQELKGHARELRVAMREAELDHLAGPMGLHLLVQQKAASEPALATPQAQQEMRQFLADLPPETWMAKADWYVGFVKRGALQDRAASGVDAMGAAQTAAGRTAPSEDPMSDMADWFATQGSHVSGRRARA